MKKNKEIKENQTANRLEQEKKYWDPHLERFPDFDKERLAQPVVVDYEKAIQNLTDILIDTRKFKEMNENIFLAMDEDNSGVL